MMYGMIYYVYIYDLQYVYTYPRNIYSLHIYGTRKTSASLASVTRSPLRMNLRRMMASAPRCVCVFFQNKQQHRNPIDNPPFTHLSYTISRNRPGSPSIFSTM